VQDDMPAEDFGLLRDRVSDEAEDGDVVLPTGVQVSGGVEGADSEGLRFFFAESVAAARVWWRVGRGPMVRLGLGRVVEVGCGAWASVGGGHGGVEWWEIRLECLGTRTVRKVNRR